MPVHYNTSLIEINNEDTITITKKEYDALIKDIAWLRCLEEAGVDNWGGIEYAQEAWHNSHPEYA